MHRFTKLFKIKKKSSSTIDQATDQMIIRKIASLIEIGVSEQVINFQNLNSEELDYLSGKEGINLIRIVKNKDKESVDDVFKAVLEMLRTYGTNTFVSFCNNTEGVKKYGFAYLVDHLVSDENDLDSNSDSYYDYNTTATDIVGKAMQACSEDGDYNHGSYHSD